MNSYVSLKEAVGDMHQKGYTSDFQLVGNDLFWIQEKLFVRAGDFSILEFHHFSNETTSEEDTILFGIEAPGHCVKGILINHYTSYTRIAPPIIKKKLAEMYACAKEYQLGRIKSMLPDPCKLFL